MVQIKSSGRGAGFRKLPGGVELSDPNLSVASRFHTICSRPPLCHYSPFSTSLLLLRPQWPLCCCSADALPVSGLSYLLIPVWNTFFHKPHASLAHLLHMSVLK